MRYAWCIVALLAISQAQAQIPRFISFQGVLADSLSQPVPDGDYQVTFSLYGQPSGGSAAWVETQTVTVRGGLFSTILGKQTLFYDSFKFDRPYWLGLRMAVGAEMNPRIELTSAAYSFSATRADTARFALSAAKPALADSARIAGTVPDNAVNSAKVADGSLQRADVAPGFTAPYADTAAVARTTLQGGATDSVRIAGTIPDNTVTSAKIVDGAVQRADVQATFKAPFADTADFARATPVSGTAGGDLTGTYPNPSIAPGAVTGTKILDATITRSDVAANFKAPFTDTADYAKSSVPAGGAGGDLSGLYPNPSIAPGAVTGAKIAANAVTTPKVAHGQLVKSLNGRTDSITISGANGTTVTTSNDTIYINSPGGSGSSGITGIQNTNNTLDVINPNGPTTTVNVRSGAIGATQLTDNGVTSVKIADGTIVRADVAAGFKAPYADTSDYAKSAPPGGTAGGDLSGTYPNPQIAANAVTSAEIADGTVTSTDIANATIQRADVVATFKAPYADTADYAKSAPPGGTAGGDLTGTYPNPTIAANAVTSAKIVDGTIVSADIADGTVTSADIATATIQRADVVATFKAPYADTADYAKSAPPGGTAGGDLTGTYPNPAIGTGAVSSAKILDGTIARADVQATFKAPYADTSDYAKAAPVTGTAGGDLSGTYPNPQIAANAVTSAEIADGTVTSTDIANATIQRADVVATFKAPYADTADYAKAAPPGGSAGGDLTGTYPNPTIGTGAVSSAKILDGTIARADVQAAFKAPYADTADYARGATLSGTAGGDLTGTYPNPSIGINAVTSIKIADGTVTSADIADGTVSSTDIANGTIQRVDVIGTFKAPFADTADFARAGSPSGSAGGDLSGTYPNPVIGTGAVSSAKILDGTIARTDVQAAFKAPYADTADFAKAAPPGGSAGGDLTGTFPNPAIGAGAVTSTKILDGTIARADVQAAFKAPFADTADFAKAGPPSGSAGGDLSGTYPNPSIASGAVTSVKILDGSIARADVQAAFKAPYADTADYAKAAAASGAAGGDLTGTYPNPSVAAGAITNAKLGAGAVTTSKVAHGQLVKSLNGRTDSITIAGANGTTVTSSNDTIYITSPAGSGSSGITGIQSTNNTIDVVNPTGPTTTVNVATGGIGNTQLAGNAVTSAKIADATIVRADVAANFKAPYADTADYAKGALISGAAGGDLSGTYPNPSIAAGAVTSAKILDGTITGADIATGAVNSATIADASITSADIANATIVRADVAATFKAPYADTADYAKGAPPSGAAGGDLTGTFPNPTIGAGAVTSAKILDATIANADIANSTITTAKVSSSGAASGQAIMYNGTSVTWGNPAAGSLALPFTGSASSSTSVLTLTNSTGSLSDSARAIHGIMSGGTSAPLASGVRGDNAGTNSEGFGVWGLHRGAGYGVYGYSAGGYGVDGYTPTGSVGVYGQSDKSDGNGILGYANGGPNAWGVYGSNSTNGAGVAGFTGSGVGIYGYAISGLAGKFTGNVSISGTLSKGGGSFKIDHPLDPENKYLYHSFVESPDMKNIYDGVVTLDASGGATVTLPDWFEALNKDFRYQLTPVGAPGPGLYIAQEVKNNRFAIAGGTAGMKVSWQVTGIRHDAFAEKNRIPVEEMKTGEERGKYLYPAAYGLPEEMGMPGDHGRAMKDKNERAKRETAGRGGR